MGQSCAKLRLRMVIQIYVVSSLSLSIAIAVYLPKAEKTTILGVGWWMVGGVGKELILRLSQSSRAKAGTELAKMNYIQLILNKKIRVALVFCCVCYLNTSYKILMSVDKGDCKYVFK
jgi:hypothetical protein